MPMYLWPLGTQFVSGLGLSLPGAPEGTPCTERLPLPRVLSSGDHWQPGQPLSTGTNLHVLMRSLSSAAGYVATLGRPNKCDSLQGAAAVVLARASRPPVGDGLACVTLIQQV